MPSTYAYATLPSDWRERFSEDPQYAALTLDQILDGINSFVIATIDAFNPWIARETGHVMRFAPLPDIPERVRPYVLVLDVTQAQLGVGPDGVSVIDQYGQGVHFTTLMEAVNRIAVARGVPIGNLVYQFGDQWAADRETRNPRPVRVMLVVPKDGGGYAGAHSWYVNPPDQDVTTGEGAIGSWGVSYYVTNIPNPGCMAIYGIGLATSPPVEDWGHEWLHGMGVDSHFPTYLELRDDIHWSPEQVAAFVSYNAAFLEAVATPPPAPPPAPTVVSVAVTGATTAMRVGKSRDLNMTVTYSDGTTTRVNEDTEATYASTDQNVLTIDQQGRVTARKIGSAAIVGRYSWRDAAGVAKSIDAPKFYLSVRKRRWWER